MDHKMIARPKDLLFEEERDPGPAHGDAEDERAVDDVEDAGDPLERRDGEQREHEEKPPHALHQQELDVEVEVDLEVLHAPEGGLEAMLMKAS